MTDADVASSTVPSPKTAGVPAPALELHHVVKSFGSRTVLDVEALDIRAGEVHALLGQNGSGKSTLIKILSGYHDPDPQPGMTVRVSGVDISPNAGDMARRAGLRFVHQDLGIVPAMSIVDNLYLGRAYPTRGLTVSTRSARANAREALAGVGLASVDPDARLGTLGPAERTGVAIARALATDSDSVPSVLVLDEPTATLPAPEVDRLLGMLRGVADAGVAVLYITHHLDEVFSIAERVTVLRDGRTVASGPVTEFSREEIIHHLVGSELEELHRPTGAAHSDGAARDEDPALVVEGLTAARIHGVSFSIAPGEIVGFHGVSGSGRDSVLGAVFGAEHRVAGSVRTAETELVPDRPDLAIANGIGFVPADRKARGGHLDLKVKENLTLPGLGAFWRRGRLDATAELTETRTWLRRLDVRPPSSADLPLSSLSGGNQQKVVLAKWLRKGPRVLLLDEPTQGVDVGAKAAIHRTVLDAAANGLAVAIASSDHEELAALCSKVHVFQRGRIVDTLVADEITEAELNRRLNHSGHGQSPTTERTRP
ncbi:sugar ABC transporter ATP-binding protein [Amycolatopsis sacchari]|uniref:Ribose transport system ATP-binding protein n=1 Tax=Amycolatopsis sacchari TaxID=115433 RepID=A0A1I3WIV9_9PSEU|nr:sugar ABC transporter ATP-binding protein [Amycolatopsis sacchari]SFK07382.1 ribose transport system ATP-binding protein [Amycolatopsis sacchari]